MAPLPLPRVFEGSGARRWTVSDQSGSDWTDSIACNGCCDGGPVLSSRSGPEPLSARSSLSGPLLGWTLPGGGQWP